MGVEDYERLGGRVSVVMCTWNGARWLSAQLDTILTQTYPLHEVIVQDDGSTDDTCSILNDYAARYNILRVYRNETNKGYNANFFSAMARATGDYIALADQDNLWQPDKIARQMAALTGRDDVLRKLTGSGRKVPLLLCSHKTRPFNDDGSPCHYDPRIPNTGLLRLVFQAEMHGHTLLFRRSLLNMVDTKAELLRYTVYDVLIELAAAAAESVVFLPEPLTSFRRHYDAATFTPMSTSEHKWSNAVSDGAFCIRHYRALRRLSQADYLALIDYLENIPCHTASKHKALKMLRLRTGSGIVNFFRFQIFSLKNRHEIFYTRGKGLANALRAWLYPILCLHYKRRYVQ